MQTREKTTTHSPGGAGAGAPSASQETSPAYSSILDASLQTRREHTLLFVHGPRTAPGQRFLRVSMGKAATQTCDAEVWAGKKGRTCFNP